MGGRYLYLRDQDSGEFWSPTWQPTRRTLAEYTCRHGLGYTIIASRYASIAAEVRYFIPLGENLEIWQLSLKNEHGHPARLSVFSSIEFCLWDAQDDATNFQRNFSTGQVEIEDGVIYHKTEYRERRNHFAYFACSEKLSGFDTQRDLFLGPYRGWEAPAAVERGECFDSVANGWAPIGSHQVDLTLDAQGDHGRSSSCWATTRILRTRSSIRPARRRSTRRRCCRSSRKYLVKSNADTAFERLKAHWDELLGAFQVRTPSADADRMVNIWNAYQCMVTFNMSRSASFYESGIGRGMGFRDSSQDLLGFVHMIPERARERHPGPGSHAAPRRRGLPPVSAAHEAGQRRRRQRFQRRPPVADPGYGRIHKGERRLVDPGGRLPYENEPGTETPLYEHLQRSLGYTLERLGPHSLPLIGRADWNDCLNLNCFSDAPGRVVPDHYQQRWEDCRVG